MFKKINEKNVKLNDDCAFYPEAWLLFNYAMLQLENEMYKFQSVKSFLFTPTRSYSTNE